jgi:hypothetical protein
MSATVIDRVTKDMRLYGEESFGPVVAVLRARDEDHAIELASDTEYGLSASGVYRRCRPCPACRSPHQVGHLPRRRADRS